MVEHLCSAASYLCARSYFSPAHKQVNNERPSAPACQELDGLLFINSAKHDVHMALPSQNTAHLSTQECKDFILR